MIEVLIWKKRAKKDNTDVSNRRIWGTKCNKYRVVESKIIFGDLPVKYYAMRLVLVRDKECWSIISKHKTQNAANKACQKHLSPPKKRKNYRKVIDA